MNEELFCDQCGEELEGRFYLRWKVSCGDPVCAEQGEYEYCCLEHDCLTAAAEADEMCDLDISCAGCGDNIFEFGPGYLLLPDGLYVHDNETCLTEYMVKVKKAERSEKFYEQLRII